ncbi:MAG: class I SAM-dependent methyltransferase [Candidatus Thiodiazotropha sp.]
MSQDHLHSHVPGVALESRPCPLGCASDDEPVLHGHDRINGLPGEYQVVRCLSCGLLRTNPRPTAQTIGFYYPDDYPPYLATRVSPSAGRPGLKAWLRKMLDTRAQAIPPLEAGRMLEIGCASGSYLHQMSARGWDVTGIEFSPQAAEMARNNGYTVHTGALEAVDLDQGGFDLVVGWMVLEHLHDPVASLRKLHEWAKPGAWMALSVPNIDSLEFRLFKQRWHALQLPSHLYHYTPRTIGSMLEKTGWQLHSIHQQRVLSSLFASLGHLLDEKGYPGLRRWVVGEPGDRIRMHQLFYPLALLVAAAGQSGRMTVWACKQ